MTHLHLQSQDMSRCYSKIHKSLGVVLPNHQTHQLSTSNLGDSRMAVTFPHIRRVLCQSSLPRLKKSTEVRATLWIHQQVEMDDWIQPQKETIRIHPQSPKKKSLPYQHIKLKSSPSSPADSGRCTHQNGIKNALHHQLQWDTGRFLLITWWLFLSWIAIMLIPHLVLKPYTKTRDNHIRSSPQKPWKLVTSRWFFHVFPKQQVMWSHKLTGFPIQNFETEWNWGLPMGPILAICNSLMRAIFRPPGQASSWWQDTFSFGSSAASYRLSSPKKRLRHLFSNFYDFIWFLCSPGEIGKSL